jgi:hypothetical protein
MKSKSFYAGVKCAEQNPTWELEQFIDAAPGKMNTPEYNDFVAGAYAQRNLKEIENLRAPPEQLSLEETHEVYDGPEDDDE